MTPAPSRRTVLTGAAALTLAAAPAQAQPQMIRLGQPFARFSLLKAGTRRYLNARDAGGRFTPVSVVTKTISFEPREGRPALHIVQQTEAGSRSVTLDSWFEPGTFRPIIHDRTTRTGEETKFEAFEFHADRIAGRRGVAGNTREGFAQPTPEPFFNYETDLEMIQVLPLGAGWAASIPFHHPGSASVARHVFKVDGRERISLPTGDALECWVVSTDYGRPADEPTRFYVARKGQQVVKVDIPVPNARVYKILLL